MASITPFGIGNGLFYPIQGYQNSGYPSVMPSQYSSDMFGGLTAPPQQSASGGKVKNGINQLQQNLITSLFSQGISPYLGGFFQSPYQANIKPSFFNYDPSKAFQNINGYQAQNINFDPSKAFSPLQQAGASSAAYDPSTWLNQVKSNTQGVGYNFNPNSYTSQNTLNALSSLGFDTATLEKIRQGMEANNKGLPSLDANTQGELNNITDSQKADLGLSYAENKRNMLNDLYSRGVNNSTIANDAAGKLMYGQQNILKGILSDAANRQISLQQNMRDAVLQNFLGQASTVKSKLDANLQGAAIGQQGDIARMNAGQQNLQFNAEAQNQANQLNAQIALQRALAGNTTAAQIAQFNAGNQQQASLFNAGQANDRGNLIGQLLGQQASQNAGFQNQAGQFNSEQAFNIANMINQGNTQIGLANTGYANNASQQNALINANMAQANLNALMQQRGQNNDLFSNMVNSFFTRKQDNKHIDQQNLALELQRQQQQAQLAFQYYQLQQQLKAQGGFLNGFSKILGGAGGLAAAFL